MIKRLTWQQIEITGDTARARWYLFMPCTVGDTGKAMWRAGLYEEEYVRVEGKWMYQSKKSAPFFHTTFEEGWAKQQFTGIYRQSYTSVGSGRR